MGIIEKANLYKGKRKTLNDRFVLGMDGDGQGIRRQFMHVLDEKIWG